MYTYTHIYILGTCLQMCGSLYAFMSESWTEPWVFVIGKYLLFESKTAEEDSLSRVLYNQIML